eukprot:9098544-Prorocentrum_lima.AAC.1
MQSSRPPAARLEAVRATKKELVLRRDKARAESVALQQQAQDKADAAARLDNKLHELDRDEMEIMRLLQAAPPSLTPI